MTVRFNPQAPMTDLERRQLTWLLVHGPVDGVGRVALDSDALAWVVRNGLARHFQLLAEP